MSNHALVAGPPTPRSLLVRVARALYRRWERLDPGQRQRMSELAEDVKGRALDLRGESGGETAEYDLRHANEELARAIGDSAELDPEQSTQEVERLRAELAEELARVARAPRKAA